MPSLFDLTGKVAIVTGSSQRHRPRHRRTHGRARRQGGNLVAQSRRLRGGRRRPSMPSMATAAPSSFRPTSRRRTICCGSLPTPPRRLARSTSWSATPPAIPTTGPWAASATTSSARSWTTTSSPTTGSSTRRCRRCWSARTARSSSCRRSAVSRLRPCSAPTASQRQPTMQLTRTSPPSTAAQGVRVNCIAPGLVRTDFARALWENPDTLKRATSTAPLRRIGEPDEIAGAAVFLASKAGAFLTGQTIVGRRRRHHRLAHDAEKLQAFEQDHARPMTPHDPEQERRRRA